MRKIAYIIPGFMASADAEPIKAVGSFFESHGIMPVYVGIPWNKKADFVAMRTYVRSFMSIYDRTHKRGDETYVFGFSFGAMIAFIAAAEIHAHTLILASVSPSFREDFPRWRESFKKELKKISYSMRDTYSADRIAKNVSAKTYAIVGSKEIVEVLWRAAEIVWKIPDAELIISKGAFHKLQQKEYMMTVKKLIDRL